MPIDAQVAALEVGDDDALGRPTIARALIAAGFATTVEDAFSRIIGHGAPGYVRREGLGPEAAIATIAAAGGIPVLAHFREAPTRLDVMRELVEAGLRGLEVYYRTFDAATVDAVGAVARDLGLIATGGSDYHGDLGTYAEAHASLWVPPEVGEAAPSGDLGLAQLAVGLGLVLHVVGRAQLDGLALALAPPAQVQRLDEDAEAIAA